MPPAAHPSVARIPPSLLTFCVRGRAVDQSQAFPSRREEWMLGKPNPNRCLLHYLWLLLGSCLLGQVRSGQGVAHPRTLPLQCQRGSNINPVNSPMGETGREGHGSDVPGDDTCVAQGQHGPCDPCSVPVRLPCSVLHLLPPLPHPSYPWGAAPFLCKDLLPAVSGGAGSPLGWLVALPSVVLPGWPGRSADSWRPCHLVQDVGPEVWSGLPSPGLRSLFVF